MFMFEVKCIVISARDQVLLFIQVENLWWSFVVTSPSVYIEYLVYQIPPAQLSLSLSLVTGVTTTLLADSEAMTPTLILNVAPT